ncbi:hypothetical protein BJY22_003821 [Kribbella shirazensis]|uniref:Alpha/beta hydrolase n=1 Tax=Kribbella shirazensis TaxID=1105143 RepID=A0A7X5VBE2_9ACTN|nr:hypothetical protein [Kribbella shirazensis]NIK58104.1 hypothetical protein [Kribbella shirazensis]
MSGCGGWCTSTRTSRSTGSLSWTAGPRRGRRGCGTNWSSPAAYWPSLTAEDYADQDLSAEAIATILERGTPHPGRSITEPATLTRPIGELPTTYIKCLMDGATPSSAVAEHLGSPSWQLAELNTGHWPMFSQPAALAEILSAAA